MRITRQQIRSRARIDGPQIPNIAPTRRRLHPRNPRQLLQRKINRVLELLYRLQRRAPFRRLPSFRESGSEDGAFCRVTGSIDDLCEEVGGESGGESGAEELVLEDAEEGVAGFGGGDAVLRRSRVSTLREPRSRPKVRR
jgi:hypothetical protein